jgi:hypothetical protein
MILPPDVTDEQTDPPGRPLGMVVPALLDSLSPVDCVRSAFLSNSRVAPPLRRMPYPLPGA